MYENSWCTCSLFKSGATLNHRHHRGVLQGDIKPSCCVISVWIIDGYVDWRTECQASSDIACNTGSDRYGHYVHHSSLLSDMNNIIISKHDILKLMRLATTNTLQFHRLRKEALTSSLCGVVFVLWMFHRRILTTLVDMATLDIVNV